MSDVFNYLTGYSKRKEYRQLLVAPVSLRGRLHRAASIARSTTPANGRPAHVIIKNNAITDPAMIRALYRASQAGVEIDLIVRGVCCLRPGVPGVSERIRVRSVVGRFLEHSRIYWFANGGQPEVYIGSADLMERNLDRRVEALCRCATPCSRITSAPSCSTPTCATRTARTSSPRTATIVTSPNGGPPLNAQQYLLEWYTTPPPDDDVVARP